MHFVGMLAAPIPADAVYLVLPTIVSFLICALVVGISLFFVSIGEPSLRRVVCVGGAARGRHRQHALCRHPRPGRAISPSQHDTAMVLLSILIAIVTAYGGLRTFLARQDGVRLIASSIAFGVAVSGMHYTAMYGMHFVPLSEAAHRHAGGLAASPQILVGGRGAAVLRHRRRLPAVAGAGAAPASGGGRAAIDPVPATGCRRRRSRVAASRRVPSPRLMPAPLGGLGQPPRAAPAARLPVEGADGTHFIDAADVRSVRADAHYTRVHDGTRERMCPWSISEAEAQLDPGLFVRVHRSHIVAIPHVTFVRKEGDGAVIELDGPSPHRVPVSRAKIAEVKARLGLGEAARLARARSGRD